jgi:CheY-like chemotaxis protein
MTLEKQSCRILVVDDHVPSANMMARAFSQAGYPTRTAYDAEDALQAVVTYDPQVILMDLALPYSSGEEIARRLHEQGSRAVLVAVSGVRGTDRHLEGDGFEYFFRKPVDPQVVVDTIDLRRETMSSAISRA